MTFFFRTPLIQGLFLLFILSAHSSGWSAPAGEIRELLGVVEQSECSFIRNNREYTAAEARKHIEKKYEHLQNRIQSAEEFIEYAASRSSLSGRPYRVLCNSTEMNAADWLTAELEKLRRKE